MLIKAIMATSKGKKQRILEKTNENNDELS